MQHSPSAPTQWVKTLLSAEICGAVESTAAGGSANAVESIRLHRVPPKYGGAESAPPWIPGKGDIFQRPQLSKCLDTVTPTDEDR